MPETLWICPDADCDGYALGIDIESVTCTLAAPHLARRTFPEMVPAQELKRAMAIARVVAEHWRDQAMARGDEPEIPWRVMAHPLALVLAALDGEQDPTAELGVEEGPDADRIRALAGVRSGSPASGDER
jgi:hypothetical protein